VKLATALGVSIPLGAITVFLMTVALRARRNKITTGVEGLIGEVAIAQTALAPSGKVFVHGEIWDAVATTNVPAGQRVVVHEGDGLQLKVDPAHDQKTTTV
jgi:membrane-bound serine protease (ClpP class)